MITIRPSSRPATTSVVVPSLSPTRIGWSTGSPASSTRTLAALPPVLGSGAGAVRLGSRAPRVYLSAGEPVLTATLACDELVDVAPVLT